MTASDFVKWHRWLREEIYPHVADLYHRREVWDDVTKFVRDQARKDAEFFLDTFTRMYVDSQASGVRRLVTGGADSISLTRLMTEVADNHLDFTRDGFRRLWNLPQGNSSDIRERAKFQVMSRQMEENWAKFAPNGEEVLDRGGVQADIERLQAKSESIKKFVDRTIAHIDRRGLDNLPSFDDLNNAVDAIGGAYCRYETLVTGSSHEHFLTPVIQGDILAPFRS
jgi:hypothetical protein